jgi:hypothetical protein
MSSERADGHAASCGGCSVQVQPRQRCRGACSWAHRSAGTGFGTDKDRCVLRAAARCSRSRSRLCVCSAAAAGVSG